MAAISVGDPVVRVVDQQAAAGDAVVGVAVGHGADEQGGAEFLNSAGCEKDRPPSIDVSSCRQRV